MVHYCRRAHGTHDGAGVCAIRTTGIALDECDNGRVVLEGHAADVDALFRVLGKHRLEDGLGKHALQLFVGEIYAQLKWKESGTLS